MGNMKRVREIRSLYKSNKKYFGKNVLDIACGGAILGFVVESNGKKYTGIDINPDMIIAAKKYAKEMKSKNKIILGDATKKNIKGKFDTVTYIGNGLCHLNTHDFLKLLDNINKNTKKGTYFVIDYRDMVKMLFEKIWDKDNVFIDKKLLVPKKIYTKSIDTQKGEVNQEGTQGKYKFRSYHTIWSPFILEPIMKSNGWKLAKREKIGRWSGWLEVYKKV